MKVLINLLNFAHMLYLRLIIKKKKAVKNTHTHTHTHKILFPYSADSKILWHKQVEREKSHLKFLIVIFRIIELTYFHSSGKMTMMS